MDKAPIKNSEPMRAWALVVAGEAVTTTKAVIANAWRAAGLEVTELTATHPTQQGLDSNVNQIISEMVELQKNGALQWQLSVLLDERLAAQAKQGEQANG